jgi:hypothetical protein
MRSWTPLSGTAFLLLVGVSAIGLHELVARAEEPQTPEQLELKTIFRAIEPVAARCAGSVECFSAATRPFGPLTITVGEAVGAADTAYAAQVVNFAFGVAGGQAGVDPAKLANEFHCGPPCAVRRMKELTGSLAGLHQLAKGFKTGGYSVVALWPDGRVRVDDAVLTGERIVSLRRTKLLGIAQTWAVAGASERANDRQLGALKLATLLRQTAATTIARDPFGGVRLIHKDSLGNNEAGLLFIDKARGTRIDPRPLADGSRYQRLMPIGDGVFFYIRT